MDNRFADKYKIKSPRLQNYDYSSSGIYFITICTLNHNNFFGKIINNQMELSKIGIITKSELLKTISLRNNLKISQWVIMPNHIHLLIEVLNLHVETPCVASLITTQFDDTKPVDKLTIANQNNLKIINPNKHDLKETPCVASLQTNSKVKIISYSHKNHPDFYKRLNQKSKQLIPKVIQQYKSAVTRQINPKTIFFAWQPRYHDIIIKDQTELIKIKNYIINNPINWEKDKYYKI